MGGEGSGRKANPSLAIVEETGGIMLGNTFAELEVGAPLPDVAVALDTKDQRLLGIAATLTPTRWLRGHLVGRLIYSAFSPDFRVRDRETEVLLRRDRTRKGSWLVHCPGGELPCGRRVRQLYVHPSSGGLACRDCLKLSYRSTLTHRRITPDMWEEMRADPDRYLESIAAAQSSQLDEDTEARILRHVVGVLLNGPPRSP
jgi:hypothetical protein